MTGLPGVAGGALGGVLGGVGALTGDVVGGVGAAASGVLTHVTTAGESLVDVAAAHGADPQAVLDANPQLPSTALPEGVSVTVPLSAPPQETGAPSTPATAGGPDVGNLAGDASLSPPGDAAPTQAGLPGGGGDWRVMTQAASPAETAPAAEGAETTDEAGLPTASPARVGLAAGDAPEAPSGLAGLFGEALSEPEGRLPPELQTAVPLGLAAALSTLGYVAVEAAQARPGDVVIVLREDGLHAEIVPLQGAQALGLEAEEPGAAFASTATDSAVILRRLDAPPGFDAPATAFRRRRRRRRSAAGAPARDPRREWLDRLLPVAEWIKARWGVPIALTVAHATLVSDWGREAPDNDYFGVRAARRAGADATPPRNGRRDDALGAYASLEEAADDLGALLAGSRNARRARSDDFAAYVEAAAEFGGCGEAYRERILCLVTLNDLALLDG